MATNTAPMLGSQHSQNILGLKTCPYGCCVQFLGSKARARRTLRRRDRQAWQKDVRTSM